MTFYLIKASLSLLLKYDIISVFREFLVHEEILLTMSRRAHKQAEDNFFFFLLSHMASGLDRERNCELMRGK